MSIRLPPAVVATPRIRLADGRDIPPSGVCWLARAAGFEARSAQDAAQLLEWRNGWRRNPRPCISVSLGVRLHQNRTAEAEQLARRGWLSPWAICSRRRCGACCQCGRAAGASWMSVCRRKRAPNSWRRRATAVESPHATWRGDRDIGGVVAGEGGLTGGGRIRRAVHAVRDRYRGRVVVMMGMSVVRQGLDQCPDAEGRPAVRWPCAIPCSFSFCFRVGGGPGHKSIIGSGVPIPKASMASADRPGEPLVMASARARYTPDRRAGSPTTCPPPRRVARS